MINGDEERDRYRLKKDLSEHEIEELDVDFNLSIKDNSSSRAFAIAVLTKEQFENLFGGDKKRLKQK